MNIHPHLIAILPQPPQVAAAGGGADVAGDEAALLLHDDAMMMQQEQHEDQQAQPLPEGIMMGGGDDEEMPAANINAEQVNLLNQQQQPVQPAGNAEVRVVGWSGTGCCAPLSGLFKSRVPPVFAACQKGDWAEALRQLQSKPVTPKWELQYRDAFRRSCLHLAVESDEFQIELIELLLNRGFDPNAQDVFGDAPLHYAVKRRRLSRSLLRLLLEAKGVNINVANGKGRTCLHLAAATPKFPRELVNLIIVKGGDVSKQSNSGRTPLNSAVRRSRKLVPIFLSHGADPFVRTRSGKNAVDWAKENNRLALQLRLEETRNVVVLCIPFVLKRVRGERYRKWQQMQEGALRGRNEGSSSIHTRDEEDQASTKEEQSHLVSETTLRKEEMSVKRGLTLWCAGWKKGTASMRASERAADGSQVLQPLKPYEAPLLTMLPIEMIRLVKDMLF